MLKYLFILLTFFKTVPAPYSSYEQEIYDNDRRWGSRDRIEASEFLRGEGYEEAYERKYSNEISNEYALEYSYEEYRDSRIGIDHWELWGKNFFWKNFFICVFERLDVFVKDYLEIFLKNEFSHNINQTR